MTLARRADDADLTLRPLGLEAIQLTDEEITAAAESSAIESDSEKAWTRYLRALAITALKKELGRRKADVVVGPELEPQAPDRLLALNGLASQLLCVSPLAESVRIPLSFWRETATAPQLLVLALVDEDQGTVQFQGVLDAAAFVAEIRHLGADAQAFTDVPLERFGGGLERLLRWLRLLEPEALPRASLSGPATAGTNGPSVMAALMQWLEHILSNGPALMPLPVLGTRGAGASTTLRLITPLVEHTADGSAIALAVCGSPSIWADTPLAEILLEQEGKVLWQQLATRQKPIEGPISWPLAPLQPQQRVTVRLRPYGAAGGSYAVLTLIAPGAAVMQKGQESIQQRLKELLETDPAARGQSLQESLQDKPSVAAEVRAQLWMCLCGKASDGSGDA